MSYDALSLFQNLKPGDKIDVQDQEGDWFETIVRKVIGSKIICHFWGFADIWDCTIEYNPSKIAPVHTYSEISKYKDNEKLLGECVWQILSRKNMLNVNKQCSPQSLLQIQQETGIPMQNMQSFLDTMDAPDHIHIKLCKYVQKYVIAHGLNLRIQELVENGADCFGFDEEIQTNIHTIENMNNIKFKISQSIHEIEQKKQISNTVQCVHVATTNTQQIAPLNLTNLSKIDLPDIADIKQTFTMDSSTTTNTTNTDNNSCDSQYIDHSNNKNKSRKNSRKRKQTVPSKKPKKRHKAAMIPSMIDDRDRGLKTKVLVTKYDAAAVKKSWMDIPDKEELLADADGKYRCSSSECFDKPAFKTYTSTCRHIQIEHQGYRYRCDLCRDEYSTEVEFRSHSTLKIHLANMHKLTKTDFSRIRIILSLVGMNSIVKKTASCDHLSFKKWKKNIIHNDHKRNRLKNKKNKNKNKFKRNVKDILSSEGEESSLDGGKSLNLGMNLDLNLTATAPAPIGRQNSEDDRVFMHRIDELISNLESDSVTKKNGNLKLKVKKKDRKPICPTCGQKFKNFQALGGHKKKHNPNWGRNRKKDKVKSVQFEAKKKDEKNEILTENEMDEDFDVLKKKKEKEICDINFSTMPQIQIKMPPPPPPKLESDSEEDVNEDILNGSSSIYVRKERKNNHFIKQYPFGPLWIPPQNMNIFSRKIIKNHNGNSNNKEYGGDVDDGKEAQWINARKMSVSEKFGSLILHFDEI